MSILDDKSTQKQAESRRLAWRCRRGMLELDIVLQRFVAQYFDGLSTAELSAFDAMLELPDNDFWTLLSSENAVLGSAVTLTVINKIKTIHLLEN
jgi:antitoxin CptB